DPRTGAGLFEPTGPGEACLCGSAWRAKMQPSAVEGDMRSVSAGRRVSAVVALLAPPALLVVIVLVFLRRPLVMLGAAACLGVGLSAAAFAVTRTGLPRAVAAALAAVAPAAAVILELTAVGSLLVVALLVALLLAGAAATRYALGRDMASLKGAPTPGAPVGPAARPGLFVDP